MSKKNDDLYDKMNDEVYNSSIVKVKPTSNLHTQLLIKHIQSIPNDSLGEASDQQKTGAVQQAQGKKLECPEGVNKTPKTNINNKIDFWEKWGKTSDKKNFDFGGKE